MPWTLCLCRQGKGQSTDGAASLGNTHSKQIRHVGGSSVATSALSRRLVSGSMVTSATLAYLPPMSLIIFFE